MQNTFCFPFFGLNDKKKKEEVIFFLRAREDSIFLTCCLWSWNIAFNDSKMISVTSHRCFIFFLTTRKCPLSQKFLFDPQKPVISTYMLLWSWSLNSWFFKIKTTINVLSSLFTALRKSVANDHRRILRFFLPKYRRRYMALFIDTLEQ